MDYKINTQQRSPRQNTNKKCRSASAETYKQAQGLRGAALSAPQTQTESLIKTKINLCKKNIPPAALSLIPQFSADTCSSDNKPSSVASFTSLFLLHTLHVWLNRLCVISPPVRGAT